MKAFSVACALVLSTQCTAQQQVPTNLVNLDAKAKALGKQYFGVCADKGTLSKPANNAIVSKVFGQVTPENSMKWESTEKSEGKFSFEGGDYLVDWAVNNSKIIRGHTLLWHSQLPAWVGKIEDASKLKGVLERHVKAMVGRYKGKLAHWDIANEIFDENGSYRKSAFHKPEKGIIMDDMIKLAFDTAAKIDPKLKLYINDYNLDVADYPKTKAMIEKVKKWRAAGVPIHGVGSQAHLKPKQAAKFKAALQALCAVAPECAVTELDVEGADPKEYAEVVKACLGIKNCVGITIWGISDAESWRKPKKPLMFDESWKEKPAFNAVVEALGGRG